MIAWPFWPNNGDCRLEFDANHRADCRLLDDYPEANHLGPAFPGPFCFRRSLQFGPNRK
jgi:hypothetical protein